MAEAFTMQPVGNTNEVKKTYTKNCTHKFTKKNQVTNISMEFEEKKNIDLTK